MSSIIRRSNFLVDKLDSMRRLNITDSSGRQVFLDSLKLINTQRYSYLFRFILKHPDKFVSMDELSSEIRSMNLDSSRKYFSILSQKLRKSPKGRELYYDIFKKNDVTQKGSMVPDFDMMDESGITSSLKKYRGKYILLDFWASWCGPCIAEIPALKSLYGRYQNKDFDILGISLDTDKKNWLKAVSDNTIPWRTFCDLRGNETESNKIFGLDKIPVLVLIDTQGKVIAFDPSVDQLKEELKMIFHF